MANQRAYPILSNETPEDLRQAIRTAYDYIYQLESKLAAVSATGEPGPTGPPGPPGPAASTDGIVSYA
jgi:hypothetical protein